MKRGLLLSLLLVLAFPMVPASAADAGEPWHPRLARLASLYPALDYSDKDYSGPRLEWICPGYSFEAPEHRRFQGRRFIDSEKMAVTVIVNRVTYGGRRRAQRALEAARKFATACDGRRVSDNGGEVWVTRYEQFRPPSIGQGALAWDSRAGVGGSADVKLENHQKRIYVRHRNVLLIASVHADGAISARKTRRVAILLFRTATR